MRERMRYIPRKLFCGLLWLAAGAAGLLESVLVGYWLWGTAYLEKYGAAENLRVWEDVSVSAVLALFVLPFLLSFLIFAIRYTRYCFRRRTRLEDEISD